MLSYFDQASDFYFQFDLIVLILDLQMPPGQVTVSHFVLEISL